MDYPNIGLVIAETVAILLLGFDFGNVRLIPIYSSDISGLLLISVVSFMTTVTTTLLIAYRIHTIARMNTVSRHGYRFRYIVVMVVESTAVSSLALLLLAIAAAIPSFGVTGTSGNEAQIYITTLANGIVVGQWLSYKIHTLTASQYGG